MPERTFTCREDANAYAKKVAISSQSITRCFSRGCEWVVVGPGVGLMEPDAKEIYEYISRIRVAFADSVDASAIAKLIKENVPLVFKACSMPDCITSADDRLLVQHLPNFLDALTRYTDGVSDKPYVKSRDFAVELAHEFHEIEAMLSSFPISKRAAKVALEMADLAGKLPLESVVANQADMHRRIAKIEHDAQPCKCGHKKKLYKGNGDYFWGCSNFPNCWKSKRNLTKEESDFLG